LNVLIFLRQTTESCEFVVSMQVIFVVAFAGFPLLVWILDQHTGLDPMRKKLFVRGDSSEFIESLRTAAFEGALFGWRHRCLGLSAGPSCTKPCADRLRRLAGPEIIEVRVS
jgi:hypothetical protein